MLTTPPSTGSIFGRVIVEDSFCWGGINIVDFAIVHYVTQESVFIAKGVSPEEAITRSVAHKSYPNVHLMESLT